MSAPPAPAPAGLGRYVNLFGSIRPYDRSWLSRDIVAGVTLAALAIPEVMGYTKIAGTPVITGLYTILVPIVAFGIFCLLVNVPEPPRWFVLHADAIDDVDYTGGKTLLELARELSSRGIVFAVAEASGALRAELDRFGVTEVIGAGRYYATLSDARDAFHASSGASSPGSA